MGLLFDKLYLQFYQTKNGCLALSHVEKSFTFKNKGILIYLYFGRWVDEGNPSFSGLDKAVGYQRAVHKLLIVMGFVPLHILRLPAGYLWYKMLKRSD